jgi:hypothetical protein
MLAFIFSVGFGLGGHVRASKVPTCRDHRTPNSSSTAFTQTFSSASVIGAAPVAVTSGGTNGTLGRMAACD